MLIQGFVFWSVLKCSFDYFLRFHRSFFNVVPVWCSLRILDAPIVFLKFSDDLLKLISGSFYAPSMIFDTSSIPLQCSTKWWTCLISMHWTIVYEFEELFHTRGLQFPIEASWILLWWFKNIYFSLSWRLSVLICQTFQYHMTNEVNWMVHCESGTSWKWHWQKILWYR